MRQDGATALIIAAQWGHEHVVRVLLDRNANIQAADNVRKAIFVVYDKVVPLALMTTSENGSTSPQPSLQHPLAPSVRGHRVDHDSWRRSRGRTETAA